MKIADLILDYGYSHDRYIMRKDLVSWITQAHPQISIRSIDTAIRSLTKENRLIRTGYGNMKITDETPRYIPIISDEIRRIHDVIHEKFPYTRFCIWQVNTLSHFMQHVPNVDIIVLETEKIAAEAIYEDIRQEGFSRKTLLRPSARECELYASGESCIIIRDLVTESPIIETDGIPMASLEKILVDAQILPELEFARGSELYYIYENASEMYAINAKSMLRYASRRGRKDETEKLIKSTMK
ncbi:MAG: hypothetical protein IKY95_05760 [Bacteroidales bacterium]|nr:hypothetical protein [Bacteroidales bacterium]MBR5298870.1 hypothetical protein [Bacteroidales bacterium]